MQSFKQYTLTCTGYSLLNALLNQLNAVRIFTHYLTKIHFKIIPHLRLPLPERSPAMASGQVMKVLKDNYNGGTN
jgi:hypothetical protein